MNILYTGAVSTVLLLAAAGANASTMSQTLTFSDETSKALSVSGFDSSLGNLTGVSAAMFGTVSIDAGSIVGRTDDGGRYFTFVESEIEIAGSGIFLIDFFDGPRAGCSGTSRTECTATYRSYSDDFSRSGTSTSFSDFIDNDVTLRLSVILGASDVDGSRTSAPSTSWKASGSLTVSYTYDELPTPSAVPLPAGLPLLLAGLGAFGIVSRRRRS